MVQWTDKPAVKPQAAVPVPAAAPKQAAASKQDQPPVIAHRPVRKARKSSFTGPLQVLTVCAFFGLIIGFFVYKEMPAASTAAAKREAVQDRDRDIATGRIVVMDHRAECREIGFDNQSGRTVHKGEIACLDQPSYDGKGTPSLYKHPTNRLESIRRSFAQ